jgi:hypothetical protein
MKSLAAFFNTSTTDRPIAGVQTEIIPFTIPGVAPGRETAPGEPCGPRRDRHYAGKILGTAYVIQLGEAALKIR